jgi:hypothetical protein
MTEFQANQIVNDPRFIDAVLAYRRRPMETDDKTYRRASLWIDAAQALTAPSRP